MIERFRFVRYAALVVLMLWMSTGRAEVITFGVVGAETQDSLASAWAPVFEAIQRRTGITVKPVFGKDYKSIVDGMNRGDIKVASFGNRSAMDVIDSGSGEVFAQWIDDSGRKGYYGHLVTLKGKPWKSVDEVILKGKKIRFAFGDPKSTSGTLVPQYYLFAQRKLNAEELFASVSRGNHELNVESILDGRVDVATTASQWLDKLAVADPEKVKRLNVIWTSPSIPQDALVWRKDLPAATKKKLREFFYSFGKKADERRLLISHLGLSGFDPSDDKQLLPVRQLELYRQRKLVEAATDISENVRFSRLMAIDNELSNFASQDAGVAEKH